MCAFVLKLPLLGLSIVLWVTAPGKKIIIYYRPLFNFVLGKEVEMVLACDEKRGSLHRKEGDGNERTGEKEERKT